MPDEFLTVADVAELLKVTEQSVNNWIYRGELPGVRVGSRRVRIRQSDLDEFLKSPPSADPVVRKSRLRALEEQVADLAARVEQLEQR